MKNLLKNLGVALVIIGAILLVSAASIPALADLADYNGFTFGSLGLIIVGLLLHIILNKRIVD